MFGSTGFARDTIQEWFIDAFLVLFTVKVGLNVHVHIALHYSPSPSLLEDKISLPGTLKSSMWTKSMNQKMSKQAAKKNSLDSRRT